MKKQLTALSVLTTALLMTVSCTGVKTVNPNSFKSSMGLDPGDVNKVATNMSNSLVSSGRLKKISGSTPIVVISNFRNNTALYDFDKNLIFNPVRVALNKSGTAYCYVKGSNDSAVNSYRSGVASHNSVENFLGNSANMKSSGKKPNYSMTLELIGTADYVGRRTNKSYSISMKLNKIGSGITIWEDLQQVGKTAKKPIIGF